MGKWEQPGAEGNRFKGMGDKRRKMSGVGIGVGVAMGFGPEIGH